ncbi:MAG: HAMP domain-containing sensor histidine kinase [Anaerolineae bacterium]|nr:HAMP domain-containing sensor histidine kinase [Anaerolineae bacterium]
MRQTIYASRETDPDFVSLATELLERNLRTLVIAVSAVYITWFLLAGVTQPDIVTINASPLTILMIAIAVFTFLLLSKNLFMAQIFWLAGLTVAIFLSLYIFQQPLLALLLTLLTLMASVTIGWQASVIFEVCIAVALWWVIPNLPAGLFPPISNLRVVTLTGSAFTGIIGWALTKTLFSLTVWALVSCQETRNKMEQAFAQRLELKQTQDDLIQANRELTRMSGRLQALYQEAEEARQAKQRFAANVSHELRTPLNMIIGFSEMIPKLSPVYGVQLPSALLSDIAAIQRNSQHLSQLIDDVLDLSQIEASQMSINKEWGSIPEMIKEAVTATRVLFEKKIFI